MSVVTQNANARVILVVEDDLAVRSMLEKALSAKYKVHSAKDGLAAAEVLGSLARIDLLVCDVMMPNIDGFTLVKMMRSQDALKALPVLFLTAKSSPQSVAQGLGLGAKHYMTKPFSVRELLEKVDKILGTP
jgi:DNA-binding response OmpR family regulator